ncbi:MAG: hypothetical protein KGO52_04955 [Nitrospirota bacterium]|nr:hypothetical protein [Nitrospirota bacterium]
MTFLAEKPEQAWESACVLKHRCSVDQRVGSGLAWGSLPRLSERPFWPLPGGNLRKFPRGLGQFPLSFLAKAQWVPRSFGEVSSQPRQSLL